MDDGYLTPDEVKMLNFCRYFSSDPFRFPNASFMELIEKLRRLCYSCGVNPETLTQGEYNALANRVTVHLPTDGDYDPDLEEELADAAAAEHALREHERGQTERWEGIVEGTTVTVEVKPAKAS